MASTQQYFSKSMNGIIEIDDGAGTVISDGNIQCNSFNTTNFTTDTLTCDSGSITTLNSTTATIPTLNSTNINNSGTITSSITNSTSGTFNSIRINQNMRSNSVTTETVSTDSINSTTINNAGTITSNTLNATTENLTTLNSTTINNSGTTTTNILETNNIETKLDTEELTITAKIVNFIGTQPNTRMFLSKYSDNHILAGTNNNMAYFDFYSYESGDKRDGQIKCTGGSSTTTDQGILNMEFASVAINATTTIPTLNSTTISNSGTITSNILNASTSGTIPTFNSTTSNITTLNSTTISNSGTVSGNILNATTSGTIPTLNSTTSNITTGNITTLNSTTSNITTGNITTLNSTTISNSGTITGDIVNASTSGTIPTFNSTTSNITTLNSTTISNSGTTTTNSLVANSISKSSGTLTITAPTIQLSGNIQFSNWLNTQTVGGKSLNTTYQNTGTAPKFISVSATNGSSSVLTAKTDSASPPTTQVAYTTLFNNVGQTLFFIVLPNNYYRVETSAGGTLQLWTEWG